MLPSWRKTSGEGERPGRELEEDRGAFRSAEMGEESEDESSMEIPAES